MTPDLIYDQMIGMGCARKLTFSWGGNPGVGSLHRLRDAVEHQWPHPLRTRRAQPRRHGGGVLRRRGAAAVRRAARLSRHRPARAQPDISARSHARSPANRWRRCRRSIPTSRSCTRSAPTAKATSPSHGIVGAAREAALAAQDADRHRRGNRRRTAAGDERHRAAALGRERGGALSGRCVPVVRARLLRARQRVLPALGRDRARARQFPGLDGRACDRRSATTAPSSPACGRAA